MPRPMFSIPAELFDRLRHDLRAQSGIPSYDPTIPSVSHLTPPESSIAGADPSPSHLRCNNCKGRLLRGVDSSFCVFCGEERFGDAIPDPLQFRDTMGCAWLLEALGVDGSESVLPIPAKDMPYRGKNKVNREIRLSDLLSVEIKWSVQEEKSAIGGEAKIARPKSFLNLGGVDLGDFVIEGTTGITLAEADKKQGDDEGNRVFESNAALTPDNLSLFGNVPASSTSGNLTEQENGKSISTWDAEFQSVDSETSRKPDQIQTLISQTHDLSFMLDSNLSSLPHSGNAHAFEK
ncbi:hypothetical protein MLD38_015770 [Melastoma candidum]|uniref:Uncharacterized protein n=1 Tax=Melastoma candidum TaxID=119954 RepID=A0ACB9RH06_9MYRT|nr:hypothetical protein MLD38_015770 [Melastoma candidum]